MLGIIRLNYVNVLYNDFQHYFQILHFQQKMQTHRDAICLESKSLRVLLPVPAVASLTLLGLCFVVF